MVATALARIAEQSDVAMKPRLKIADRKKFINITS
jgi:hypothetical protein